jgi:hypothetical protein
VEPPTSTLRSVDGLLGFASGFSVLGFEVILQHQLSQVMINSHLSEAIVLAVVLVSLAGAALLAPLLERGRKREGAALRGSLKIAALLALLQPFFFLEQRPDLRLLPYELDRCRVCSHSCSTVTRNASRRSDLLQAAPLRALPYIRPCCGLRRWNFLVKCLNTRRAFLVRTIETS